MFSEEHVQTTWDMNTCRSNMLTCGNAWWNIWKCQCMINRCQKVTSTYICYKMICNSLIFYHIRVANFNICANFIPYILMRFPHLWGSSSSNIWNGINPDLEQSLTLPTTNGIRRNRYSCWTKYRISPHSVCFTLPRTICNTVHVSYHKRHGRGSHTHIPDHQARIKTFWFILHQEWLNLRLTTKTIKVKATVPVLSKKWITHTTLTQSTGQRPKEAIRHSDIYSNSTSTLST